MDRASDLATPSATRSVLDMFGLSPKKSFGQNFLVNDDVVKKTLDLSEACEEDVVLEVGPGIGTLTNALLKRALKVIAIEADSSLPVVLQHTLAQWMHKLRIVEKDALDVGVADLGQPLPNKLIANLPYSVAATLILDYFQRFDFLESQTVMVQKEVASRICAKSGTKDYGAYTVKLSMYAKVVGQFDVGPSNFMPPPHVNSAVIRLDRCVAADDWKDLEVVQASCIMADAAFASRRKTLANSCKQYFASRGASGKNVISELGNIFEEAGIDPSVRGETLTKYQFIALGKAFLMNR